MSEKRLDSAIQPSIDSTHKQIPTTDILSSSKERELVSIFARLLRARCLLILWGDTPYPLRLLLPANRALVLNEWLERSVEISPLVDSLFNLPPSPILSLDPSDQVSQAFKRRGVPLQIVRTRHDVPVHDRPVILKLAGDLKGREGVVLSYDEIETLSRDQEKRYLLELAHRLAEGGVMLFVGCDPFDNSFRIWWKHLAPMFRDLPKFAIGDPTIKWPADVFCLGPTISVLNLFEHQSPLPISTKGEGEPGKLAPVLGTGNRWAVLVGIDKYQDRANYGKLYACGKDAAAIQKQLLLGGFEQDRIHLLSDDTPANPPTYASILATLKAVSVATDPNDLLLFYFSGHGDESNGESYLIPSDGQRLVLSDTAIPISRIKAIMNDAAARAKVIIVDACHSGADIAGKGPRPMSPEFIYYVFEQAEGLAVLASCKQGQLSYQLRNRTRSVFTHFLLKALTGEADWDHKGCVTVQDASRFVVNGVKLWASMHRLSQTPTLQYIVSGDIILVTC